METASIFYSEEDDLRSWFYSKHLVEQERQEHIKRLREQGIIIPEEELVEEKGEPTMFWLYATKLILVNLSHCFLACEQALQLWRTKRAPRERTRERRLLLHDDSLSPPIWRACSHANCF